LAEADAVSLHLPLASELVGFVNREFLRRMRPGSILVNTARGPLVDEDALAEALTTGHVRAAALDVLATEPVTAHNPLRDLPNVILTPHVASFTVEAWRRVVTRAVDNALAVLADRLPNALVDPAVWERRRGRA
jgi:phosphoglycerate dehydrogenase-like enzyme